jgi:glycosyltransferase involved in cell wall biosynthesis
LRSAGKKSKLSGMSVSFCLIALNEEKNLERSLSSIKPVADEIILTDTGSTDGTIQIAQKFGAKISHFQWCDDFSKARNFCFQQATGDWIFWIDADEEFLPESADELRRCLSREDVFTFLVLRQDLTELSRLDFYSEMWLPRLFRRHKDIQLIGRIHEQFKPSLPEFASRQGQVVEGCGIRIRHYGFAGPKRADKFPRDVKLLELELQERPGQLYYQIELYRTLLLMGDNKWRAVFNEAVENMRKHIAEEKSPSPQVALLLETLLQLPENELPAGITRAQIRGLAGKWFARSAPLLWLLAKQDYEQSRFEDAEKRLRLLLQMGKEHSYDKTVGFDPHILAAEAELNLAVCLIRQTKLVEAEVILKSLSARGEHRMAAEENLSAIKRIRLGFSGRGQRKSR